MGNPVALADFWELRYILKLTDLAAQIGRVMKGYNLSNIGILDIFVFEYCIDSFFCVMFRCMVFGVTLFF